MSNKSHKTQSDLEKRDVLHVLQDIYSDLLSHLRDDTRPDEDQIGVWMDRLTLVSVIAGNLIISCEDLIENGGRPEDIVSMKKAVALSHGQENYVPRKHHW